MTPIEQMRDPEATRSALLQAIEQLSPDSAQWWVYNVSLKRFMLRLYNAGLSDYLMIATFGARHIAGPTHWSAPALEFSIRCETEPFGPDHWWDVDDRGAGFALSCNSLYWGQNVGWDDKTGWFSAYADPSRP